MVKGLQQEEVKAAADLMAQREIRGAVREEARVTVKVKARGRAEVRGAVRVRAKAGARVRVRVRAGDKFFTKKISGGVYYAWI
jgi:head-tail adaptor